MHELNTQRIPKLLEKYGQALGGWEGRTVAVLGLSFKRNTNDMREAPSVKTIPYLLEKGAKVQGFDPQAIATAPFFIKDHQNLSYHQSIEAAVKGAEVIMALVEWPEIVNFDFSKVRNSAEEQWFIDARNQFDPQVIEDWGFNYLGVGR